MMNVEHINPDVASAELDQTTDPVPAIGSTAVREQIAPFGAQFFKKLPDMPELSGISPLASDGTIKGGEKKDFAFQEM